MSATISPVVGVSCQFYDADVCNAFPGFKAPDRSGNVMTINPWQIQETPFECDGIVALSVGPQDAPTLLLTMGADSARKLAESLLAAADREDAKLDEDEGDD